MKGKREEKYICLCLHEETRKRYQENNSKRSPEVGRWAGDGEQRGWEGVFLTFILVESFIFGPRESVIYSKTLHLTTKDNDTGSLVGEARLHASGLPEPALGRGG